MEKIRFGFIGWDWKDQPEADDLSRVTRAINAPVVFTDFNDGSDSTTMAVHTFPCDLTGGEWSMLERMFHEYEPKYIKEADGAYEGTLEEIRRELQEYEDEAG